MKKIMVSSLVLGALAIGGCASQPVVEPAPAPVVAPAAPAAAEAKPAEVRPDSYSALEADSSRQLQVGGFAAGFGAPLPKLGPQSPDEAYEAVLRGNERFVRGAVTHDNQDEWRRKSLSGDQKPHTIVLSCSDSRVPPELVLDQGLGDLFVIRVAGNILGSAQVASIEYAIEHLGAKLILVMGHESCGAVKAAINTPIGQSTGSTDIDWMIASIRPNIRSAVPAWDGRMPASLQELSDPKYRKPVMANVDAVTDILVKRSKIVREAIEHGQVKVARGIYSLDSGKVDFWGYNENPGAGDKPEQAKKEEAQVPRGRQPASIPVPDPLAHPATGHASGHAH